jgi:hypothetical protein
MDFLRRTLIFLIFFCILSVTAFARDITIIVEDEELGLPLEGAVVSLRGGQKFVCDEDGKALVNLGDDRQQVVQISYPGYDTKRLTIPPAVAGINHLTAALRLSGVLQGRELVLEAQRPETSETKSGRSVAISEREMERTAEIGIVEDVMKSVKLLPGVGYTGMFSAMPSIRGGDPGDLMAVFDGFYLERPYHWFGAISIFDPKMVSSARLSHGVFSSRYGHTISGLLEVTSKSPSPTETEIEASVSTSAASVNLSYPLNGKGGILFMGKVTYWDTLVWAAQGISHVVENEALDMVDTVSTAPYIRSAALSANYRFSPGLEWRLNFFFGSDGVGAEFHNKYNDDDVRGSVDIYADFDNYQGFLISGITASPLPALALRFLGGVGFIETKTDDQISNNVTAHYNQEFLDKYAERLKITDKDTYTVPDRNIIIELENTIFSAQGRADIDWDLGRGFIAAFGVQELYSLWLQKEYINLSLEVPVARLNLSSFALAGIDIEHELPVFSLADEEHAALIRPMSYPGDVHNQGFTTSAYGLIEYTSPNQRFGAELGVRMDHLYFKGKDFGAQTLPVLNPRLNFDFGILKNRSSIESLDFTVGTGLFSSINNLISFMEQSSGIGDYDMKLNRSWTSIAGIKLDLYQGYSFNIEGYYKYVFDRAYITYITPDTISSGIIKPNFNFDGVGHVWGFDLLLQKMESRYVDGWISYSFNWVKYMDPNGSDQGVSMDRSNGMNMDSATGRGKLWYYPSFHRFHNCNLVLNIKPLRWLNIATRFGFASGRPRNKTGNTIYSYPVQALDENNKVITDERGNPLIIQKYRRDSWYDENERSYWSLPLDVKFSFFLFDRKGKVNTEIYFAAENLLAMVYAPTDNTRFNNYTGKEDTMSLSDAFNFPIPMASFGFKWRY